MIYSFLYIRHIKQPTPHRPLPTYHPHSPSLTTYPIVDKKVPGRYPGPHVPGSLPGTHNPTPVHPGRGFPPRPTDRATGSPTSSHSLPYRHRPAQVLRVMRKKHLVKMSNYALLERTVIRLKLASSINAQGSIASFTHTHARSATTECKYSLRQSKTFLYRTKNTHHYIVVSLSVFLMRDRDYTYFALRAHGAYNTVLHRSYVGSALHSTR